MCGIVGYVGSREATPLIVNGLKNLEYRGYDSAGIAVIQDGEIAVRRDVGKLVNLEALLQAEPVTGHIGMGHTPHRLHRPSRRHPERHC
jgi:glucosamine--fructose-6-phosphate aminotransferase (isomerizing)